MEAQNCSIRRSRMSPIMCQLCADFATGVTCSYPWIVVVVPCYAVVSPKVFPNGLSKRLTYSL